MSIRLSKTLNAPIVNADSRQIYREMKIGTARPQEEELRRARFYFVGCKSIKDPYSAAMYEKEALAVIGKLHRESRYVILSGGSMLYADAVMRGIDDIPDVKPEIRSRLKSILTEQGPEPLLSELRKVDPEYYAAADIRNPRRVIRALEVFLSSGVKYSSLRVKKFTPRPFRSLRIELTMDRQQLFSHINARVDRMIASGLEEEARSLLPFRSLPALDTVGYREMFRFFDGEITREEAIARIKKNTRVYAKKQMTWYKKDSSISRFDASDFDGILNFIMQETRERT